MRAGASGELGTPLLQPVSDGDPESLVHGDNEGEEANYELETENSSGMNTSADDYESHFTLRIPTSTVHFRGSTVRVIDTDQDQIILQQRMNGSGEQQKVLVKRLSPVTYAQRVLRLGYTLITILFLGFLFVFSFQVLLFLFIALPVESGYTSDVRKKVEVIKVISTLLSFPLMMYGLSSLMALGSAFVVDTYNGAALFRSTIVEILYMCVFFIVPTLTLAFSLMTRDDEPWRNATRVWAVLVCITFSLWALAVTYIDVKSCLRLVEKHFCKDIDEKLSGSPVEGQDSRLMKDLKRLLHIANRAVIITQTARYGGEKSERYLFAGADVAASQDHVPVETKSSFYSRLTTLSFLSCIFQPLDPPKRIVNSEDVHPFMTKNNWSMQKMWCSGDSRRNNVVVARGPSALTEAQIKYSVLCTVISSIVAALLILGALIWMQFGLGSYLIVALIAVLCCIVPIVRNGVEMYRMYDGVNSEDSLVDREDEINLFQVWRAYRITKPRQWYCYFWMGIETTFFFLWPFISQLTSRNYPVATVFFFLGIGSFLWRYFDTSKVISEIGSMSRATDDSEHHHEKYRLNEVVTRVIDSSGRVIWSWIFMVFFLATLYLFMGSQQGSDTIMPSDRKARPPILLLDDFYYPPHEDSLAYPTCELTKGFNFPGKSASDLGDYAFLSAMAYEKSVITNYTLDKWFGSGTVVDEEEYVSQFREQHDHFSTPVFFKLFSFPSFPGYGVMSIRGSETSFDWLANMQLWSAAGLGQVVKWLTPMGWVWQPILPDLVSLVNTIEAKSISDASYYKVTTSFVNEVLAGYGKEFGMEFSNIQVTGASLGGGLAIITGAQTDAFAVAISGLGATLSRDSFDPPIELEKLDSQTFNFIPERDFIARIGGRAPLFQNAQCIAPKNSLFGCHSMWRSVCEINYRCGSNSRPVLCRCVDKFGYPPPVQNGTRSFEDACKEANDTWYEMFPPN